MKINVSIDLEGFMDDFGGESLEQLIAEEGRIEVLKIVKKDPKYKAYINKKANEVIGNIEI